MKINLYLNPYSFLAMLSLLLLVGCHGITEGNKMSRTEKALLEERLEFNCAKQVDVVPPITPESDAWFQKARVLEKTPGATYSEIGQLYRKAAEQNHWKAMYNLQNLIANGKVAPLEGLTAEDETIDIVEKMIALNIPAGFNALGYYLDIGFGVKQDSAAAIVYYRKAADLGHPQAQYRIGNIFLNVVNPDSTMNLLHRPEIGIKMLTCAAEQGEPEAAGRLGAYYKSNKIYDKSLYFFHLALKNGHTWAGIALNRGFLGPSAEDKITFLNVARDDERARRYQLIHDEISAYSYAKFPDIDDIVPLPPAPLPKWDGTFQYRKDIEKNKASQ